ncbi:aquaporin [Nocardioides solisilvae]|uniref:aquaporin n=1 Tax=Nocardioides solisilvae TaxID=1542435 RepID=UPI0013A57FD2|nr:aquaporin [Nocardioides solisilvae]
MTGGTAAETTRTPDETADAPTTAQKIAAEVLGTFVLVLFGCGAAVMSGDYVTTGLSFGLAVLVMVAAFGRISGGHFNPAVTLGAALGGRLAWRDTPVYMGAQLLGAILAGACLLGLMLGFSDFSAGDNLGQNAFGDQTLRDYAWWAALLLELLMTMLFVLVVLGVTDARNSTLAALAPIAIGLALAGIHFASMSATGTSVNPARSIGVALFVDTDAMAQLWLFVLAPLLGAAIAGTTYPLLFGQGAAAVPGSGLSFSSRPKAPKAQQLPGYGQPAPGAAWAGVAGQPHPGQPQPGQWGAPPQAPAPTGQWGAPDPQWGQAAPTQTRQPYQEQGYPPPPQQPPAQQPGQWGAPPQQPQQGWGAPPPPDEEDGRTQIRPGG